MKRTNRRVLVLGLMMAVIATGAMLSVGAPRGTAADRNLSLLLRSPQDDASADAMTTGVTVRQLVDEHGVLPPRVVLTQPS